MLTKDLLKFRNRGDRVFPVLVDADDSGALALATQLLSVFTDCKDMAVGELENIIEPISHSHKLGPAFAKLLCDRLTLAEVDDAIGEQRWQWITAAQEVRRGMVAKTLEEYRAALAAQTGTAYESMAATLFNDLAEHRRILAFEDLSPVDLIHRYNCALVQGLLLRAENLTITLKAAPVAEKRALMRLLKFHRLLADIEPAGEELRLTLGGPLAIFDQAQSYGGRLANFFPHVLNVRSWSLEAKVKLGTRTLRLLVDDSHGLKSHYRALSSYTPEEFSAFLASFNQGSHGWKAAPSEELLNFGNQNYCFPDFTLRSKSGKTVHVNCFTAGIAANFRNGLSL